MWESDNQSTGILSVINENCQPIFATVCIERGDRNNERNVSNVPPGVYPLVYEYSPRFKRKLYELKDVPNRSECKVHASNYWHQLNGCIAPGDRLLDMDADGYYDVTNSRASLDKFHDALMGVEKTTIEIIDP
jgi:hypothetical protein